ncbi:hypothetical protein CAEBREN_25196 [Caenorhabditis brenneri]|uniref:Uncharacterized protein n=1 Tax=Caenorhabditis brenneri TaxID=135651 RepID=G0NP75_CAEBE|nr:hypothetical protein CAEBREN_25196 [Caenorhabditis brenneri]
MKEQNQMACNSETTNGGVSQENTNGNRALGAFGGGDASIEDTCKMNGSYAIQEPCSSKFVSWMNQVYPTIRSAQTKSCRTKSEDVTR